jgi:hypothetical protein
MLPPLSLAIFLVAQPPAAPAPAPPPSVTPPPAAKPAAPPAFKPGDIVYLRPRPGVRSAVVRITSVDPAVFEAWHRIPAYRVALMEPTFRRQGKVVVWPVNTRVEVKDVLAAPLIDGVAPVRVQVVGGPAGLARSDELSADPSRARGPRSMERNARDMRDRFGNGYGVGDFPPARRPVRAWDAP